MSNTEDSAATFLHFGHRYEVIAAFKGWFDSFTPGENFVYLKSATSVYDSAIGFFFYDTATGKTKRYDTEWTGGRASIERISFVSVLKDLGADMIVRRVAITGQLTDINWECFRKHVDYLQSYVEGKEDIKSWYLWLEENIPELQTVAGRAQLLRLKNSGPSEAQTILNQLGVPFTPSPRYGWT